MNTRFLLGVTLALVVPVPAAQASPPTVTNPHVIREFRHDETPKALREMPLLAGRPSEPPRPRRFITRPPAPSGPDLAVQTAVGASLLAPQTLNFEGLGWGLPFDPATLPIVYWPDSNLSVGDRQVVETINFQLAVFDKSTGSLLYGPAADSSLWGGFGGWCETGFPSDPLVVFDEAAQRWVIAHQVVPEGSTVAKAECIAVSQTSDATGAYYRYSFDLQPTGWIDYIKLGVWPDAYYLSNNSTDGHSRFPQVCALDRSRMLAGAAATAQCFFAYGSYAFRALLLPSDLDGATPPPPGAPNYFLGLDPQRNDALNLFRFHVDFSNPLNSTLTGPIQMQIQGYSVRSGGMAQPAVNDRLDNSPHLMYRLAYRNFGDYESLVANHTVDAGGGVAGIRWYEIRDPGAATPTVYQQGTFSPDSSDRWMGSIAMDRVGDIALGYSVSSASLYPSIYYTGRVPSDPLGTLESEAAIIRGTGSAVGDGTWARWGDYTSMSIDPADDCTFWYVNEYFAETGTKVHTRIASFRFPGCSGPGGPGDCNGDGAVNAVDLQEMVNCLLLYGTCRCRDLNRDGTLNAQDLQMMVNCILAVPGGSCCFADTGDGTIHDSCTGLQWEKKTSTAGLRNVDNLYTWAGCCGGTCTESNYCQPNAGAEAACRRQTASELWASGGCNQCGAETCTVDPLGYGAITTVWDWVSQLNGTNFASHDDWRLATSAGCCGSPSGEPAELESILNLTLGPRTIDPIFGPTKEDAYWAASTRSSGPLFAWRVAFRDGAVYASPKESSGCVRAVRDLSR